MDQVAIISLVIALLALFVSGLTFWMRYKDYHLKLERDKRELERDQQKLDAYLYYESNQNEVRLVISNRGYRTVTVEKATINYFNLTQGHNALESVPQKKSFKEREYKKLPSTLKEHEKVELILSKEVAKMALNHGGYKLEVSVYDLERNIFKISRIERFDPRINELSIREL